MPRDTQCICQSLFSPAIDQLRFFFLLGAIPCCPDYLLPTHSLLLLFLRQGTGEGFCDPDHYTVVDLQVNNSGDEVISTVRERGVNTSSQTGDSQKTVTVPTAI